MAFGAETALEGRRPAIPGHRQLLINFETGNLCGFTDVCQSNCVLNARAVPAAAEMSVDEKREALRELITQGESIRHLAFVGKEPLGNLDVLFGQALPLYHSTAPNARPGTVGIITSGLGLAKEIPRFRELPLSWAILSIDTPETGLRRPELSWKHLGDAVRLRGAGGVAQLGVNSLLRDNNFESLLKVGERLMDCELDQWSISPMVHPVGESMKSICSPAEVEAFLWRLAERFAGRGLEIILDADFETFSALAGGEESGFALHDKWRIEREFHGSGIAVAALNKREGYFARCRWDGQISAKSEFTKVGLKRGRYGRYHPGRLGRLLLELSGMRDQLLPTVAVEGVLCRA